MLCVYCSQVDIDPRIMKDFRGRNLRETMNSNSWYTTGQSRSDLYPDFPGLKASAEAGCQLCSSLRHQILQSFEQKPLEFKSQDPLWFRFSDEDDDSEIDGSVQDEWDNRMEVSKFFVGFDRHWINRLQVRVGNSEFVMTRSIIYDIQAEDDT
jgi:hypothetical protein